MLKLNKKKVIVIFLLIFFLIMTVIGISGFYYNNFGRYKQIQIIVENDASKYYIKIPKETSEEDIEILKHVIKSNIKLCKIVKHGKYDSDTYEQIKEISQNVVTMDNYKSIDNISNQEVEQIIDANLSSLSDIAMICLTTSQKNYILFYDSIIKRQNQTKKYYNGALSNALYIPENIFENYVDDYNKRNEIIVKYISY